MENKMNTAQLRDQARKAAHNLEWQKAADLYQQAYDVYPPHHPASELSVKDKAYLLNEAKCCARFAASNF
jgi:hypothetical protein